MGSCVNEFTHNGRKKKGKLVSLCKLRNKSSCMEIRRERLPEKGFAPFALSLTCSNARNGIKLRFPTHRYCGLVECHARRTVELIFTFKAFATLRSASVDNNLKSVSERLLMCRCDAAGVRKDSREFKERKNWEKPFSFNACAVCLSHCASWASGFRRYLVFLLSFYIYYNWRDFPVSVFRDFLFRKKCSTMREKTCKNCKPWAQRRSRKSFNGSGRKRVKRTRCKVPFHFRRGISLQGRKSSYCILPRWKSHCSSFELH